MPANPEGKDLAVLIWANKMVIKLCLVSLDSASFHKKGLP